MAARPCLVFDFDGVIHESPEWLPVCGEIDTGGIRLAHECGYAVAVVTCSPLHQVADALRARGLRVHVDYALEHEWWGGGPDGEVVLVTGRKVVAVAYLDDRAVHHRYGQPWEGAFAEIERQAAWRQEMRAGSRDAGDGGRRDTSRRGS